LKRRCHSQSPARGKGSPDNIINMLNKKTVCFFFLLLFTFMHSYGQSQPAPFDIEKWTKDLSSAKDIGYTSTKELFPIIHEQDSLNVFNSITVLEFKSETNNHYYKARVTCFKAAAKFHYKNYTSLSEITDLAEKATKEAYQTHDERFIAFIYWLCGATMINSQQLALGIIYRLRAEEIYSGIGYLDYNYSKNWGGLGELLFHSRDYDQSIFYTKKALHSWEEESVEADYLRIRYYNTIAQAYEQMNNLDSAMVYLDTSFMLAEKGNHDNWKAINSGFKGQLLFKMNKYSEAKPLLQYDYAINSKRENPDVSAKSLQWLARINLIEGKNDSALLKSREAVELIKKTKLKYYLQPSRYLEMCYSALAESFKAMGELDSFYHYHRLYSSLHDSIQQVAFQSSSRIVQMKIENENVLHAIQLLQKEKKNEVIKRNLVIIAIVLLSLFVFLYIRHVMLKQRHKEEMVLQEKRMAETELILAKQQMQQFTENIVEKSHLIEKLNHQLSGESNGANQQILEELTSYTILTEADWENFKRMFEKIYPDFFRSLKEKAPTITVAEQRMAALIRLDISSKQMASMLGVSVDSVHKTKQRLRQRLHVTDETNLGKTLAFL
jgi:DNA-binding CsgD family transcriptional regulator